MNNNAGYTFIELLIGVVVMGILFTIALTSMRDFNRRQIVISGGRQIRTDIRLAQNEALAGRKPPTCLGTLLRINFTRISNTQYEIRAICSLTPNGVQTHIKDMPNGTIMNAFSPPTTGGPPPDTLQFKSVGDGTNLNSSTTILVTSPTSTYVDTIVVSPTGEVR